ncbi:hypothetical protein F2P81_016120 [Scophthalmus maximus]|uniref:Uncharacterized protein n=1 Tax=Scophthalmus maximus TaxID=52904 RepID=A0A6A4SG37_SCOMX|nr:hypothetical protein F2P81_016120 [Scophthalmus maximus]
MRVRPRESDSDARLKCEHPKQRKGSFGLYLSVCCSAMKNVEFMDTFNNTLNIQDIAAKFPCELGEEWHTGAHNIKIYERRRVKLNDFVDRKANIAMDPIHGMGRNAGPRRQARGPLDERLQRKCDDKRGLINGATVVSDQTGSPRSKPETRVMGSQRCAFSKPCLFCNSGGHASGTM